jgi:hypothetical protein
MSLHGRRELLRVSHGRYASARRSEKSRILDEFVAATGYHRDYAVTLLGRPLPSAHAQASGTPTAASKAKRTRKRRYTPEVQRVLTKLWELSDGLCGKRLVPAIPDLLDALERHEGNAGWSLDPSVKERLLTISAASADRLLSKARRGRKPVGLSTTRPGTLLKQHIPIRTFSDWNEDAAGFVEADLVAHCGETTAGEYLNTLNLTDVKTGWTDFEALINRSQKTVSTAVHAIRKRLPFALLGLDTDNGSEFINHLLFGYCDEEMITFSRGRPFKKNDQCFVEQKNFSVVRKTVGYARLEGEECCKALNGFYAALRLYVNFFQPSMKLKSKERNGAKVHRTYEPALSPYRRVLACPEVPEWVKEKLRQKFMTLNPVELLAEMECWRARLNKAIETWNRK